MFPRAKLRRHLEKNKLGLKNNITDTYIDIFIPQEVQQNFYCKEV